MQKIGFSTDLRDIDLWVLTANADVEMGASITERHVTYRREPMALPVNLNVIPSGYESSLLRMSIIFDRSSHK